MTRLMEKLKRASAIAPAVIMSHERHEQIARAERRMNFIARRV